MQQLRDRDEARATPPGAGARYCTKLARYPERRAECSLCQAARHAVRALLRATVLRFVPKRKRA
jgi:hypothetical protein